MTRASIRCLRFLVAFLLSSFAVSPAIAQLEILDPYGRPAMIVTNELRLRVIETAPGGPSGGPGPYLYINNESTLDAEQIQMTEVSAGVFVSGPVTLYDEPANSYDGRFSAPLGSVVSVTYNGFYYPNQQTASATVGAGLELMDGDWQPANSFLLGELVRVELRYLGADVSPGLDTASVSLASGLAVDSETLQLTETASRSGIFRAILPSAYNPGAASPGNGILEVRSGDSIHSAFAGSDPVAADLTPVSGAARVELLDAAGRPAATFGSGETARLRVIDLTAAGSSVSASASCGSGEDSENLLLSDFAAGSGSRVFEAEVPVSIGAATAGNRRLECPAEGPLHFTYVDLTGTATRAVASLTEGSIAFLDEAGSPATEVLDGRSSTVRVKAASRNLQPNAFDTVTAIVSSRNTYDSESVVLTETTLASGIFEGSVRISSQPSLEPQVDVASGGPSNPGPDQVTAAFGAAAATADVLPARLSLRDRDGRELTAVLPDSTFEVWVAMPSFGSPTSPDYLYAELLTPTMGVTQIMLYETTASSQIFWAPIGVSNFYLQPGHSVTVRLSMPGVNLSKQLEVTASLTRFVGSAGEQVDTLAVNRPVTIEVTRAQQQHIPWELEQIQVKLRSQRGGDLETVVLTETDYWSAVFRGSLPLQLGAAYSGNGILQAASGAPFGDTVHVEPADSSEILASAELKRPEIRLLDAAGREATRLVRGQRYEIEVEDPSYDVPYTFAADTLSVELRSRDGAGTQLVGSAELRETGLASGVFRGGLMVVSDPAQCRHGVACIELAAGEEAIVRHQLAESSGQIEAAAVVAVQTIELVDAAGRPTAQVLEGAPIRIRLVDSSQQPGMLEHRTAIAASRLAGEIETVLLWETSAGSGIFERTLATRLQPLGSGGQTGDGELALGAHPATGVETGEVVLVSFDPGDGGPAIEATAPTVAARLTVLDSFGQPTTQISGAGTITLRLEFPTLAASGQPAIFKVESQATSDLEVFFANTSSGGVFTVQAILQAIDHLGNPNDGVVSIYSGGIVVVEAQLLGDVHNGSLSLKLPVGIPQLRFLDPASGQPLEAAPDLRPFKVQLFEVNTSSWGTPESRDITLTSLLGDDSETIQLARVPGTSVAYEAIVTPRITTYPADEPGVLEVSRRAGGIFDRITARFQSSPSSAVTASLPLSGPRMEWTDAAGTPVSEVITGTIAYLLIDDPFGNTDPATVNGLPVLVSEGTGYENLVLTETGPDTGIFRGSLPVAAGESEPYNGVLEAWPGAFEHFRYSMSTIFGSLVKEVRIRGEQLLFVGADGQAAAGYGLGETLRLRLVDADPSHSPALVDSVQVRLGSIPLGLDDEILELVETGADSGVFEGTMATASAPAVTGNGILEIGRGLDFDRAIAVYGDSSAEVSFTPAIRLRLIDRLGREITRLGVDNQQLGVEITRQAGNDPEVVETLPGPVLAEQLGHPWVYDAEHLSLVETGPATGVFRAFLPTGWDQTGPFDGKLHIDHLYGGNIKVSYTEGPDTIEASLTALADLAPQVYPDHTQLSAGSSATYDVLFNDYDPEGTQLLLGAAFGTPGISAGVAPDGTLALVAAPDASGFHQVFYLVSDQAGSIAEGRIDVYVVSAPQVTILAPADGTVIPEQAEQIEISAAAFETQDGDLGSQIQWTSEGHYFGSGPLLTIPTTQLPPGSHQFTATVTSSQGVTGSASVTIVLDGAPALAVTYPLVDTYQLQEGPNTFTAAVTDPEEPGLGEQLAWSSNSQDLGPATGTTVTVNLTQLGSHQITAVVTDRAGNRVSEVRYVSVNGRPQVDISGYQNNPRFLPGQLTELGALAWDPDGDSLTYEWTLDGVVLEDTGRVVPVPGLAAGHHTFTVVVRDGHGGETSASASFTLLAPPTLTITAPAGDLVVLQGESVTFAATATAFDGTDISDRIEWYSNLHGGPLGHGAGFSTSSLEHGLHLIHVLVVDEDGLAAEAGPIEIEVHLPPYLSISSPAAGSHFQAGTPVTLAATASDAEDGDLSAQIAWSSSRDGALGTGATLMTSALSAGGHVLTAAVADSHGATASASVSITISDNTAPLVTVLSPAAGSKVAAGEPITFSATAIDAESGDLSASLVWTSNQVAGNIGTGASFSRTLPAGNHLIIAKATDPQGEQGSAAFFLNVVTVNTQVFVSAGPQDGFVLESGEDTGAGGLASTGQLRLGDNLADRQYRSFLSFDTSALPDGALIRKVTVRAYRSGTTGVNPATTHGELSVDVKTGFFGASAALENADFQDAATVAGTCLMTPAAANGQWSTGLFDAAGRAAVNLAGVTQVRLRLALDDDDDATNDYLDHYGGESTVSSTRPQLVVEYLP